MGDWLDAAVQAASDARTAVAAAVETAAPTNLASFLTMSSSGSTDLSKLNTISGQVPGVLRIEVAKATAYALMGVSGAGQWGSFIGTNTENVISWTAPGPADPQAMIGLLSLSFATAAAEPLAGALLSLFDAIAGSLRWQS